uniref:Uncharacterized protein n=1 Tax=Pseudictyota dubia TaxID=2749911 RepID=A0A7R9W3G9_9STRA
MLRKELAIPECVFPVAFAFCAFGDCYSASTWLLSLGDDCQRLFDTCSIVAEMECVAASLYLGYCGGQWLRSFSNGIALILLPSFVLILYCRLFVFKTSEAVSYWYV